MWPRWQGSGPFPRHHHSAVDWATHRDTGRRPGTPRAGRRRDREERGPRPTATVTIQGNVQWRKKWYGTWQLCYMRSICPWARLHCVHGNMFQYAFCILVLVVFELIISGAYPSSVDSKAPFIKNKGLYFFDVILIFIMLLYMCQLSNAVKHKYFFSGINTSWNHSTFGQNILTSSTEALAILLP